MASLDVLVPSYQYGRYLRACLMSILSQDLNSLRVLVIDNASTDNSVEIARDIAANDSRVEVVTRKVNLGATASWNEGIDWAQADYFLVVCADDFLTSNSLPRALEFLEGHPEVSFAIGKDRYCTEATEALEVGEFWGTPKWRTMPGPRFIREQCRYPSVSAAPIVRTAMQKKAGYYRSDLPFTDDLEMMLRLACVGHVAQTSACWLVRRLHESNISSILWRTTARRLEEGDATFSKFFSREGSLVPGAKRLQRLAAQSFGKQAYWSAVSHLCRGDLASSKRLFEWAFSRAPSTRILPPVGYLLLMESPIERVWNTLRHTFQTL